MALELEERIHLFMDKLITPFIVKEHFPNHACDRFMALVGKWADIGSHLRWPYRSIPEEYVIKVREEGYRIIPEFLGKCLLLYLFVHGLKSPIASKRKNSCSDTGNIDLVVKRSEDGGKTWSRIITVWDDGDNVCGNPSPIVDQETGRIILVSCWNLGEDHEKQIIDKTSKDSRRVYVLYSDNDGKSWSTPKEITSSVKHPDWTWYATGPCHGIQLQGKKNKGRL